MANKALEQLTQKTPKSGDVFYFVRNGSDFKAIFEDLGTTVVSDTYTNISTLKSNTNLASGTMYFVSDKNVYIKAVSGDAFDPWGVLKVTNADYQTHSQWVSNSDGGSYSSGDKAIYNNKVFENTTGTNTDTAPPSDGTNWTEISSDGNTTDYNIEYDSVYYDFDNDEVLLREDSRGNQVGGGLSYVQSNDPIGEFQWGNDSVTNNVVYSSRIKDCLNQRGTIDGNFCVGKAEMQVSDNSSSVSFNIVTSQSTLKANENTAGITRCRIEGNSTADYDNNTGSKDENVVIQESSFTSTGTGAGMSNNTVTEKSSLTINTSTNAYNRNIVKNSSTLNITNNSVIEGVTFSEDLTFTNDSTLSESYIYEKGRSTIVETYNVSQTISDFPAQNEVVISGNVVVLYEGSDSIEVSGSSSNDGTFTVSSSSYDFGNDETTITITANSFTVEAGAGTVTGEIIDLSDINYAGYIEIQADVNVNLREMKDADGNHPYYIYPQNNLNVTIEDGGGVGSVGSDQFVLIGGANTTLTGRSSFEGSDFMVVRHFSGGLWNREIMQSVLP